MRFHVVRYMTGMTLSPQAQAVLDEGRNLFRRFHATSFPNKIRQDCKLGRADAGWYQVRRALEAFGDTQFTDFAPSKPHMLTYPRSCAHRCSSLVFCQARARSSRPPPPLEKPKRLGYT